MNAEPNEVQRKADELRAQCENVAYALLCVGPADMGITGRTQRVGRTQQDPDVTAKQEKWLREDLALHVATERLAVLAEPVLVPDVDESGYATLTVLAITIPWDTLRRTGKEGRSEG